MSLEPSNAGGSTGDSGKLPLDSDSPQSPQGSSNAGGSTGEPSQPTSRQPVEWTRSPNSSDEEKKGNSGNESSPWPSSDEDYSRGNRGKGKASAEPREIIYTQDAEWVDQNPGRTPYRTKGNLDEFLMRMIPEQAAQSTNNEQGSSEAEASSSQQQPPGTSSQQDRPSRFAEDFSSDSDSSGDESS